MHVHLCIHILGLLTQLWFNQQDRCSFNRFILLVREYLGIITSALHQLTLD